MNDNVKAAFGAISASEELKNSARMFVAQKTRGYKRNTAMNYRRVIPITAAACSVLAVFVGVKLYFTPTTHITIDINPSLDLGINYFDKVVSVEPLNDDGKALAETLDLRLASYDEALRRILDNENVEEMLSENEVMTVTVVETGSAQCENILYGVRECTEAHSGVHCHSASSADASAARTLGLSYERYSAYLQLRSLNYAITPEELNSMSMREIRDLIASLSGGNITDNTSSSTIPSGEHHDEPEHDTGHGNGHHGHGYGHE